MLRNIHLAILNIMDASIPFLRPNNCTSTCFLVCSDINIEINNLLISNSLINITQAEMSQNISFSSVYVSQVYIVINKSTPRLPGTFFLTLVS